MKKFIIPLLTVVMVVSIILAGCVPATPPEGPETSEPPSGPAEQPPEEPELPPEEPELPPVQYPWQSICVWEYPAAPSGVDILEVNIGLGREFSPSELETLADMVRDEVKLVDENGKDYYPVSGSASKDAAIIMMDPFIFWQADFAYHIQFKVGSRSCSYTLYWPDYPPLEIGNPFESPFW